MNKEIEKLEEIILKHNDDYRSGDPKISDVEYDKLVERLKELNPKSNLLTKSILETPKSRKENLPVRMASLDKKKSLDEVIKWAESIHIKKNDIIIITPKYDGISLLTSGNNCWTRGNGFVGQSSPTHYSLMNSGELLELEVFGEAIMKRGVFEEKYSSKYKSARNLVAGLFNRDIPSVILEDVDLIKYGTLIQKNKSDQLDELNSLTGNVTDYLPVMLEDISEELLQQLREMWSADYNIDGLVLEVDDYRKRVELGRNENGNPIYAVAYKDADWNEIYSTNGLSVEVKVSKQGKLIPVVNIDPTDIDGVIVSRASAYNMKFISDNQISEGCELEIVRSGDVIPKIVKVLKSDKEKYFELMDELVVCPSCGEVVKWDSTMTNLICVNEKCQGIINAKIEHFFESLKFEEFSDASIKSLIEAGYNNLYSILTITKEELLKINGWADSSSDSLLKQLRNLEIKGIPFARLLYALDLFEGVIGEKTCQLILDSMLDVHMSSLSDIKIPELIKIKGVAETTAKAFKDGIDKFIEEYFTWIFDIIGISYYQSPKIELTGDKCLGMKVCFTGVRDSNLEEFIKMEGGFIVDGVSKNTTHLIVKDNSEKVMSSSKAKSALKLEIEICTIEQFKNKLNYE